MVVPNRYWTQTDRDEDTLVGAEWKRKWDWKREWEWKRERKRKWKRK
jgi:hypothetical protein